LPCMCIIRITLCSLTRNNTNLKVIAHVTDIFRKKIPHSASCLLIEAGSKPIPQYLHCWRLVHGSNFECVEF